MTTISITNYESHKIEDMDRCEKINRRKKAVMPVHRCRSAIRASHRTPSSRRTSHAVSGRNSGKHHRRLRRHL